MSEVVVTGIGVAAPNGVGAEEYWKAVVAGESGIRPISRFDTARYPIKLAGEVPEFDAEQDFTRRLMPQTDRLTRLALFAAEFALEDAEIVPEELPSYSMGVAVSSSTGGLEFGQRELQALWGTGWESVSAYMSFAWYYAVHTGQISIRYGMQGPSGVVVSEQAGGLDALGYARRRVRKGTAVMTAGGLDGLICPYGVAIQSSTGEVGTGTDPERAYLPFHLDSAGHAIGEGGAVLVLESREDAERRGAPRLYGTLAGYGAAFDPDPAGPGGDGLVRAARQALADAGRSAQDVDVVFADAAGTSALDRAEADALCTLFGERGVPVAAPKALTGRLLSGGGPLDVATALLAIRDGLVPAVAAAPPGRVDPRIDLVAGAPRSLEIGTALVLARGRGGFASALVLTGP
ncbi:ketosynthase chain-length factor [Kitasatospora griseola]|uniref:ketosynthase chain-length factor n=1 Tax=Kitasatospora griseola TaxID=2064 RepID=UPI00167023CD|nr:ketosynthase chain-length factor [Kitasatospora griseola]GGQ55017.1 actinorhodin polyketide putative beta-ketoacyl synthase 2 [Kitasatospora griseola]